MGNISVTSDFDRFCKSLRMSDTTVSSIQNRYHAITKRVNTDYWNSSSDTLHSLYVGSYGRGTSIYTSDIDIVVELPWSEYTRYNNYSENGQSALLAGLRSCLLKTYSSTSISQMDRLLTSHFPTELNSRLYLLLSIQMEADFVTQIQTMEALGRV